MNKKVYFRRNKFTKHLIIKILSIFIFIFCLIIIKSYVKSRIWTDITIIFINLAHKYKYLLKNKNIISEDCPIWIMWYQGIENAPPIIKSCVYSIITNRAKHPVIILNKYNLYDYVSLPAYIVEKFNKGLLTITPFSDIIRIAVLYKHGGYWIDSSYLITSPINYINTTFYTLKLNHCFTYNHPFVKCIWSGNFLAVPKNSFIATYCYFSFLYYLKKYNKFINYFLIDYIISIAYNNIPEFKNDIDKLPSVTCNIFLLFNKLNSDYDKNYYLCPFNKLNRRGKWNIYNGKNITNYGYIIYNYKFSY